MFRVESCLRVCTWDPAHGKPYASAQAELSFWGGGVGGGRLLTVVGLNPLSPRTEPGRHELYRYYMFIESPEKVAASPNQNVSCRFTQQQPEGQRPAGAVKGSLTQVVRVRNLGALHRTNTIPHCHQVACLTHQLLLSTPFCTPLVHPSLHPQRGGEESREDFRAAGGDRLSVPSTYTNGRISAPHKNN